MSGKFFGRERGPSSAAIPPPIHLGLDPEAFGRLLRGGTINGVPEAAEQAPSGDWAQFVGIPTADGNPWFNSPINNADTHATHEPNTSPGTTGPEQLSDGQWVKNPDGTWRVRGYDPELLRQQQGEAVRKYLLKGLIPPDDEYPPVIVETIRNYLANNPGRLAQSTPASGIHGAGLSTDVDRAALLGKLSEPQEQLEPSSHDAPAPRPQNDLHLLSDLFPQSQRSPGVWDSLVAFIRELRSDRIIREKQTGPRGVEIVAGLAFWGILGTVGWLNAGDVVHDNLEVVCRNVPFNPCSVLPRHADIQSQIIEPNVQKDKP